MAYKANALMQLAKSILCASCFTPISKKFMDYRHNNNALVMKRSDSNESIEIKEQTQAESPTKIVEAINGDARAIVTNFLARNSLKPKPVTASSPTTPTPEINQSPAAMTSVKSYSLQERRRIFLNEDAKKTDKKIEELRTERKKSISEEVLLRKTEKKPSLEMKLNSPVKTKVEVIKSIVEKKKERQDCEAKPSPTLRSRVESTTGFTTETKPRKPITTTASMENEAATVVLRKKTVTATAPSQLPIPAKLQLANAPRKQSSRNDEPELMKVFARRSLKVKDEDVINLNEKISTARRTICVATHGMDSDKENQSASIERLNKLMSLGAGTGKQEVEDADNNNEKKSLANGTADNAKNNINNNNNTPLSPTKIISVTHENNKLNNNNNNSDNSKTKVDNMDVTNGNKVTTRGKFQAIQERAATMGEFKNINQRRAEWEQRAKGVLN